MTPFCNCRPTPCKAGRACDRIPMHRFRAFKMRERRYALSGERRSPLILAVIGRPNGLLLRHPFPQNRQTPANKPSAHCSGGLYQNNPLQSTTQKVGESNFVKMYNDRIICGVIDFSQYHGAIFCPNCGERIATRYITKMDKKEAYRLVPSAFNKRKV